MIRIVSLKSYKPRKGETLIKVDRSSVLGNPFPMRDERKRGEVCDKYAEHFKVNMLKDERCLQELRRIYQLAKSSDVALACWCAPKRCHAETIKFFLESYL